MRYVISAAELVGLLVGLILLGNAQVEAAIWVSLGIFVVALVALIFGWRPPRIGSRGKAFMVVLVCLTSFVVMGPILKERQEAELAALRTTDIDAYLTKLHELDEDRWLAELRDLRPKEHRAEVARRQAEAEAQRIAECTDRKAGEAYVMIQADVRRQLKAPSTADFPGRQGAGTRHVGNCVYQVFGYFDAQNGFGAMLRGSFEGKIEYFPDSGSWRTITLKVDG